MIHGDLMKTTRNGYISRGQGAIDGWEGGRDRIINTGFTICRSLPLPQASVQALQNWSLIK